MRRGLPMPDLLSELPARAGREPIDDGAIVLRRFAVPHADALLAAVARVTAAAPFRHLTTPGGHVMSVAMTNCGDLGWVSDRGGYRYQRTDPLGGAPWPAMPAALRALATEAAAEAGYAGFVPDACLINRYEPGARLTPHQDRNERDLTQPIVSVSLGLPAVFLFGGLRRSDRPRRIRLEHGDVVVWGAATRLAHHGVERLDDGLHPATGRCRINLTFRRAG
jgi:alkylated DNA repair protein (DNA oxidative demethylase)